MKSSVILALDIGTSSTRSAIYDTRGRRVMATTAQFDYPLFTGEDGRAELRPTDLDRAVALAFEKTLGAWRKLGSPSPIAGIGVSCFYHSLLGLDAKGRPMTPVYTWADSRCWREAQLLREKHGEAALHARTGCMVRASFWPAKLLWLRKTSPGLFRKVARWVSPAEWIQERWCAVATSSLSMASGTGLLDGRTLKWHRPLLRRCGIGENRLNPVSDAPTAISKIRARRFPELARALWHPAIGDGAASNLGSGATLPGIAAINVGTSAALRVVVAARPGAHEPPAPFGLFAYRIDARRRLVGGAVSNAGNLRAWAIRELKLPADPAVIEKLLGARSRPAGKLTLLPFWMAERAPTWPEELPSAVIGITQATTALDLLQALQEATYHRLTQIAAAVEKAARRNLAFIVSGGIQNSPAALRRLANVLGRPIHASTEPEASLRGAACFVMEKLGLQPPMPRLGPIIRPRPEAARAYARARQRQTRLEALLRKADLPSICD
ncbi:MAG TPA: FGGY family carbohydrate kinase [Candidatus Methylacidiphilales bacterium]|jgi:gluconokinase|nr:FGGY family carbohydrate kinase [Candidatus Methylacidiphilales bacterium]